MLNLFFTKNKYKLLSIFLVVFGLFFFYSFLVSAATSPDAIGLRVMPNSEHYSAYRWYNEQGFDGSPQSITVDGYEAVRDGRTVYVNAANVSVSSDLYTNIYIISYNQSAETATTDIFGQILSHWKFNTNLVEPGICSQSNDIICLTNGNCPINEYCLSQKAKTIRDTRRLSDMVEINRALENYKEIRGHYPQLESGSYLPNKTLSTWPSWQDNLATELGIVLPIDPVNELGSCEGYDETTCWDSDTKEFSGSIPDDLPENSQVYVYSTEGIGLTGICGVMESGFITNLDLGACAISAVEQIFIIENNQPIFMGDNLAKAHSGFAYSKSYIEASDPDGDYLNWSIEPMSGCDMWENIMLENTQVASQKEIKADSAGIAGDCQVTITINDSRENGQVSKNYYIKTTNDNVPIIMQPANQEIIIGHNFNLTIIASETDSQYPLTFEVSGLPSGLTGTVVNQHDYQITGVPIDQTKDYNITLTAQDSYQGQSVPINFTITVKNNPPNIATDNLTQATACINYEQAIVATDPDGHSIDNYQVNNLPLNLNFDTTNNRITGQPIITGEYPIEAIVQDQFYNQTIPPYSAQGIKTFTLNVVDEQFNVNPINNTTIYVYPNNATLPLYYGPTQFNATASVANTDNTVIYSLVNNPAWLSIDQNSGVIQGTPTDNTNDLGTYTITVIAINLCGAIAQTDFMITVNPNEWYGDDTCNGDEECDVNADDCGVCCTPITCASLGYECGTYSDGCTGTINCGTCVSPNMCSAGRCCPSTAGIQVCADNCHETYFNGQYVSSACDWSSVQEFEVTIQPGKNVISTKATDWGALYGVSATLNRGSCSSMTTNELTNWKCTTSPGSGWNSTSYDDSSWLSATYGYPGTAGIRAGNYLPYAQIWAQGVGCCTTVYCRYTFMAE